jgi:hypothetical protein
VTYNPREAEMWFARDYDNFVDLAAPSPPPAPKEEEDDMEFPDDGDDGAESSDYIAFYRL